MGRAARRNVVPNTEGGMGWGGERGYHPRSIPDRFFLYRYLFCVPPPGSRFLATNPRLAAKFKLVEGRVDSE